MSSQTGYLVATGGHGAYQIVYITLQESHLALLKLFAKIQKKS